MTAFGKTTLDCRHARELICSDNGADSTANALAERCPISRAGKQSINSECPPQNAWTRVLDARRIDTRLAAEEFPSCPVA